MVLHPRPIHRASALDSPPDPGNPPEADGLTDANA